MSRNHCFAALCVALLCSACPAYAATCAPQQLVHIVVTDITPGIPAGAFAAKPRSLYRVGDDKMRIEEASDPANGIHGVVVIAEPNIWMANLYDGTGKHLVDPGPSLLTEAPVFGGASQRSLLASSSVARVISSRQTPQIPSEAKRLAVSGSMSIGLRMERTLSKS